MRRHREGSGACAQLLHGTARLEAVKGLDVVPPRDHFVLACFCPQPPHALDFSATGLTEHTGKPDILCIALPALKMFLAHSHSQDTHQHTDLLKHSSLGLERLASSCTCRLLFRSRRIPDRR